MDKQFDGYNQEIVEQYMKSTKADSFTEWFDKHTEFQVGMMTQWEKKRLARLLVAQKMNSLDEPYVGYLVRVTQRILGRECLHDNDHEYFKLQDELTKKVERYIHVIVNNALV